MEADEGGSEGESGGERAGEPGGERGVELEVEPEGVESTKERRRRPYARARARGPLLSTTVGAMLHGVEPFEMRSFGKSVERMSKSVRWADLLQRRNSLTSAVLKHLVAALGDRFHSREKKARGWVVFAQAPEGRVAVFRLDRTIVRNWDEMNQRIRLRVLRDDLFRLEDLAPLDEHSARLKIQLPNSD